MAPYPEFSEVVPAQPIWTSQNTDESTLKHHAPLPPKKARRDSKRLEASQEDSRWWTRSGQSLECPLTGFPIRLLPYPPFKLRVDPQKPSPQILVDGKLLAMQLIADGHATHGLRALENSDIQALDSYIQRCKLGPWRPGIAQSLAKEMVSATSEEQRHRAASELQKMRSKTRSELRKLYRIQDNRLAQMLPEKGQSQVRELDLNIQKISTGHLVTDVKDLQVESCKVKGLEFLCRLQI